MYRIGQVLSEKVIILNPEQQLLHRHIQTPTSMSTAEHLILVNQTKMISNRRNTVSLYETRFSHGQINTKPNLSIIKTKKTVSSDLFSQSVTNLHFMPSLTFSRLDELLCVYVRYAPLRRASVCCNRSGFVTWRKVFWFYNTTAV